eukprot:jgi/Bigna1/126744/aug1.3_g1452
MGKAAQQGAELGWENTHSSIQRVVHPEGQGGPGNPYAVATGGLIYPGMIGGYLTAGSGSGISNASTSSSGGYGGGGGAIKIEVDIEIAVLGSISSDGEVGQGMQSPFCAIGGGAGGSVHIKAYEITSQPDAVQAKISAAGGGGEKEEEVKENQGDCVGDGIGNGGGGGGYVILELPYDAKTSYFRQLQADRITVGGGETRFPQGRGEDGGILRIPSCPLGKEGILCSPCDPGYYRSNVSKFSCSECPPGTYAPKNGDPCAAGTYAQYPGQAYCNICEAGSYSEEGADECKVCDPGTYRGPTDPGNSCIKCPIGYYSQANASSCLECNNLPENAKWGGHNDCTYTCRRGHMREGSDCVIPLEALLSKLGGVDYVAITIVGILVVSLLPFLLCCPCEPCEGLRGGGARKRDTGGGTRENEDSEYTENGLDPLLNVSTQDAKLESFDAHRVSATGKRSHHTSMCIRPQEVHLLMHRIYLHGANIPSSPLHINPRDVPMNVGVNLDSFEKFCEALNFVSHWSRWESRAYTIFSLLYLPLAQWYLLRKQESKIEKIKKYISGYNHEFFRNYHLRMVGNSLRFGHTKADTFGWIDFVAPNETTMYEITDGVQSLPLVITCSGSGLFSDPFRLDVEDNLMKAIIRSIGNAGPQIAVLNSHLRTVHAGNYSSLMRAKRYIPVINSAKSLKRKNLFFSLGVRVSTQLMPIDSRYSVVGYWRPVLILKQRSSEAAAPPHQAGPQLGSIYGNNNQVVGVVTEKKQRLPTDDDFHFPSDNNNNNGENASKHLHTNGVKQQLGNAGDQQQLFSAREERYRKNEGGRGNSRDGDDGAPAYGGRGAGRRGGGRNGLSSLSDAMSDEEGGEELPIEEEEEEKEEGKRRRRKTTASLMQRSLADLLHSNKRRAAEGGGKQQQQQQLSSHDSKGGGFYHFNDMRKITSVSSIGFSDSRALSTRQSRNNSGQFGRQRLASYTTLTSDMEDEDDDPDPGGDDTSSSGREAVVVFLYRCCCNRRCGKEQLISLRDHSEIFCD